MTDEELDGGVALVSGGLEARYHLEMGERERARARRRLSDVQANIGRLEAQLGNEAFTTRARPEVVAEARRRLEDARREEATLRAQEERT